MPSERQQAIAEFKRILKWIVLAALLMVAGALLYLKMYSTLDANTVMAVTFGVFFSVVLGCGLFAIAFFSNKSGIDQQVTDATVEERERKTCEGGRGSPAAGSEGKAWRQGSYASPLACSGPRIEWWQRRRSSLKSATLPSPG